MDDIISQIRQELRQNSDEKTRISGQRFFKEKIKIYGVRTAMVSRIAKNHFARIKKSDRKEIFGLCRQLWQSGYMEESFIACSWSYALRNSYDREDFAIFESWIENYIANWASCDTFCNHTVGAFIEMYPAYIKDLKRWAKLPNRWMRRAAAVSLIVPARRGKFLDDVFRISDILFSDPDDMVQKGYGWLLKVASQAHQKEVFEYVMARKQKMPRTSLRYAVEKMPQNLRRQAMSK